MSSESGTSKADPASAVSIPYVLKKNGATYALKKGGVIKVERPFANLIEPWTRVRNIPDYLGAVDHSLRITEEEYERALERESKIFNLLARKLAARGKSLVVGLQGRDAAGKSGVVKCIQRALGNDNKIFDSILIGPPTDEEKAHHFLWRFHKYDRMPAKGQVRVFDRFWVERVLVERVMHYASRDEIRKSYAQIRVFEWQLIQQNTVLVKLWLDVSKKEQKVRFDNRKKKKKWKVSKHDKIARKHWDGYTEAANEMFYRTGSDFAPYYIVSSDDKRYARIRVLKLLNKILREALAE
jgi:polyphosphate kinase 2 (PPK2 family)